ncbi:hypothetical protein Bca52824_011098 [Brassica carinata]|uniref:Uncharacterized protein n=1 Tax=Brassica carinata TaxID=52824 RepID=A0A8X7WFN4_BRACI|nr:hypothetical protein Bca52824_011098 [Brassica carinata]
MYSSSVVLDFYTEYGEGTSKKLLVSFSIQDEALSFIPTISLPSNAASFAFKRRFIPSDKLSYWYKFDSNMWSAVYKHIW